ncbi:MAG: hypothetical protein ACRDO7_13975, partial [Nocardioidaceae bacterium]
ESCEFVTAAGNLDRVVTPLCTFEVSGGKLVVGSVHAGIDGDVVRERTGFEVDLDRCAETPPPTEEELDALHTADPQGIRYSEFRSEPQT